MRLRAELGALLLSAAAIWSWNDQATCAAPAADEATQKQTSGDFKPWGWLKSRVRRVQEAAQRKAEAPGPAKNEASGQLGWTFEDIDIQTALGRIERFGLKLPVDVEGRATIEIRIDLPWRSMLAAGDYRLYGWVESSRLSVAGVEINDLHATLSYADGLLKLSELRLEAPEFAAAGEKTAFEGAAEVQLDPQGDLTANVDFRRFDLAALAEFTGQNDDQVKLSGAADGHAEAKVAIDRFRDLAGWQIEARLSVDALQAFEAREFHVEAEARLAEGVARLSRLSARMHDSPATISGAATLPLEPPGELQAKLILEQLELAPLIEGQPQLADLAAGRLGGQFTAAVAFDRIQDPAAWRAGGRLSAAELRAVGLPPAEVSADFQLRDGRLAVANLAGDAEFFHLEGGGELAVQGDFAYSANVRLTSRRLSRLNQLKPELRLPVEIGGRLGAAAAIEGAIKSSEFSARGGVKARDVRVEELALGRLEFSFDADHTRLQLHPVDAELFGGRVRASAVIPLDANGELRAGLRWNDVSLASLAKTYASLSPAPAGRATGTLEIRAPGAAFGDVKQWNADGRVEIDRLRVDGASGAAITGGRANADLHLSAGKLRLEQVKAAWGTTTLDARLELGATAPFDFSFQMALSNGDLSLVDLLPAAWRPPTPLAGRIGVSARFRGGLEPLQLAGQGALAAKRVRLAQVLLDSVSASFSADDKQLRLSKLQADLYGGRLTGSLAAPLQAGGAGDAKLNWSGVQLGRLLADWQSTPVYLHGASQGRVELAAEQDALSDPTQWHGQVSLGADDFPLWGWQIKQAALEAQLKAGELQMSKLAVETAATAQQPATKFSSSGKLHVAAPYDFQLQFDLADFDLARLHALPPKRRPPVTLAGLINSSGQAQGTLEPLRATGEGKLSAAALEAAGAAIESLQLALVVDDESVQLNDLSARLYEGQITGDIRFPLVETSGGRVAIEAQHVDVGKLLADVKGLSYRVTGLADGRFDAEIPPGRLQNPADWQLHAALDASEIAVESLPVGQFHARFDYRRAALEYRANGDLLAGAWEASGAWREPDQEHPAGVNRGSFAIDKAQLARIGELLRRRGTVDSLAGTVGVQIDYRHDPATGRPVGQGKFELVELRAGGALLSNRILGAVRATPEAVRIEQLTGSFAGGLLRAAGEWFLKPGRRSRLRASLYAAELGRLLQGRLPPGFRITGAADVDASVFFGARRPWRFDGIASIRKAEIDNIPVSDVRAAFDGAYNPVSGRSELRVRNLRAQLAHGRMTASVTVKSASGLSFNGQTKFSDVGVHDLLKRWSTASRYGVGRMTGEMTFAGRDVRSLRDLTATLNAKLRSTEAASLPLAHVLQPHIAGGLTGSSRFGDGDVRARLSRGVVRVERLSLNSPNVRLYIQGAASLAGRLNLSVVANTGQSTSTPGLLVVAGRLSTLVAPPVGLLLEASQLLANQVIYLDVTGTFHSPTVRIRPLPTLENEALRFFLLEAPVP